MKINYLQDYLNRAVMNYGDNIAIQFNKREITYRELQHNSILIRDALKNLNVEQNDFVGIFMGKSDITIAVMFGILQCGGAYIPLDTMHSPITRIAEIVKETGLKVLITTRKYITRILEDNECKDVFQRITILLVDEDYKDDMKDQEFKSIVQMNWAIQEKVENNNDFSENEDDTAYILFTSGSTGKPKGVVISHLNAITFVDWCCSYFKPDAKDKFLSVAPFHFDLSIFDIYVSIASGGRLIIIPSEKERNLLNYLDYIRQCEITYIYSVPSLWTAFLRYGHLEIGELKSISHVLFAGEVFQPDSLKKAMEYLPDAKFYNLYGLIETNVFMYYEVPGVESVGSEPVPIGYVCDKSDAFIIKDNREVVNYDEEGELCMCGPILMKGYYNNDNLTKSVITPSPIKHHNGKLLFHTGDIVKKNKDGAFILIGRNDFMVKKNGYRIELGEIETAMASLPYVEEVAVIAGNDIHHNLLIYAAITLNDNNEVTIKMIKENLANLVPNYMIPDYICIVDEFKRSMNGKIDREYLKGEWKL